MMDSLQKIDNSSSLIKARNLISIINKILNENKTTALVLFDLAKHNKTNEVETQLLRFIADNFWHFLEEIIKTVRDGAIVNATVDDDMIVILDQHDLNYEFPRAFYRRRGNSATDVTKEYDEEIESKNGFYLWCSPPIEIEFRKTVMSKINNRIVGAILTKLEGTSIGRIIGIEVNYHTLDN